MTSQSDTITYAQAASRVREKYQEELARIKSRKDLVQGAKNAAMARAKLAADAGIEELKQAHDEAKKTVRAQNERIAFGVDDLAVSPGDRAAIVMAHRAALDRVAKVTDHREGAELLAHARMTGDDTLVRAVALHAHNQVRASGYQSQPWQDVLADAVNARPRAVEAVQAMQNEDRHVAQGPEFFQFVPVSAAAELGQIRNDWDLKRIIDNDPAVQ